jgi:hypothetical protein
MTSGGALTLVSRERSSAGISSQPRPPRGSLGSLNLTEALDLTLLIRETDRWRYERTAIRWLERFIEERRPTLAELALALAADTRAGLRHSPSGRGRES